MFVTSFPTYYVMPFFCFFQNGNVFHSSATIGLDVMDGVIEALDIAKEIR
jgi:hypothetical protein